jgi:glutamate/tyrosine decarboxylase-like PLP-dependent enzyme
MRLAEFAEAQLRADPLWEITSHSQMAVVTFRCAPESWPAERLDALNRAIAAYMQEEGFALVLSTGLRGQTVLRLCTINPRTSEEDIAKTVAELGQSARKAMQDLDKLSG